MAAGAVAAMVAGPALAQDGQPLTACAGAVGAWLTTNPGKEPSRTLLSLTADGLVLSADSGQGGAANFAPFTGGHGAWRCVASDAGSLRLSATIVDFTVATADWPEQRVARLDIDATLDAAKGTMSGTMTLSMAPLDDDPMIDAELTEDAGGTFTAIRITAP
jgi:hypothetical protein